MAATCGDGIVQAGVEQCDDANGVNTDGCLNSCVRATCGDGVVRAGVEQCDDGNAVDADACPGTCVLATCGDGFVQAGIDWAAAFCRSPSSMKVAIRPRWKARRACRETIPGAITDCPSSIPLI